MEYQKTKKAYKVAHKDEINRDYNPEWIGEIIYAETTKKAIQKYFKKVAFEYEYKLIDIRAKRQPGADLYLFEGESRVMGEIIRITEYRAWLKKMNDLIDANPNAKVKIWSGEKQAYWRENRCGYTDNSKDAGIYEIKEAWSAVSHVGIEKRISFQILDFNENMFPENEHCHCD